MQPDPPEKETKLDQQGVPFGRYRLLRKIATGGMAQLYLASISGAADFQKFCVIKKILPHLAEQPHFVEMFLDEARIASGLSHPNIVNIFDLGTVGNAYFIAMEYIAGEDLAHLFSKANEKAQPLPVELCARVAADICAGLHYAHEHRNPKGEPLNIVHRDVSPQNILMTFEGQIKIVDFGIAKAANKVAHTRTGTIMGKAAYMSPEQCLGQDLDRRSDVFAVGILLHEMLTLQRLFKRPNELVTLRAITEEDAPRVSSIRPGAPKILDDIVATALARDPSQRFASCLAMREALEHFIADFGVPATSLDLGELLDLYFPGQASKRQRMYEAGSLSEVIQALPSTGVHDLGTPSVQAASIRTLTETENLSGARRSTNRSRGKTKGLALAGILALFALAGAWWWQQNAAPPTPKKGSLVLTSEPVGAQVRLNGKIQGRTPITLSQLDLDTAFQLELAVSGFRPHHANLYLSKARPDLEQHITLQALPVSQLASLEIKTIPSGAKLFLDNLDTGQTSPALLKDVSGGVEHELRVELPGFKIERRRFMPRPGILSRVDLRLKKNAPNKTPPPTKGPIRHKPTPPPVQAAQQPETGFGQLNLQTEPWTVVYEGATELGETPLYKMKLSAGEHRLRVRNPGKKIDQIVVVTIKKDQTTTLSKELQVAQ